MRRVLLITAIEIKMPICMTARRAPSPIYSRLALHEVKEIERGYPIARVQGRSCVFSVRRFGV